MVYQLDENHLDIVEAFEKLGCKVVDNAKVKRQEGGQLDIWVGFSNPYVYGGMGIWVWVEIKTETGVLRRRQLENIQEASDKGLPVEVVKNTADVETVFHKYRDMMQNTNVANICVDCGLLPASTELCDCIPF